MKRPHRLRWTLLAPFASLAFFALLAISVFSGCDKNPFQKTPPQADSKDFRIDRCDIQYRGQAFPVTGTMADMVKLLGPYDRLDTASGRHFWDSLGLQVDAHLGNGQINGVEIHFAREESDSEIGHRLAGRPEDSIALIDIRSTYPHGFFKGELILEGARIGSEIDFSQVNDTRQLYLKTQSGPDAHLISIERSWSNTRYAYERTCADGRHFRFFFFLLSSVPPFRMQSVGIVSDNVKDSVFVPPVPKAP
jgi:hypothetical protein